VSLTLPTEGRFAPRAGQATPLLSPDRRPGSYSQLARRSTAMPKPLVTARYRLVLTFQDVASSVVMPGWQSCLGANPASPLSPDRRPARSHAVTACRHYLTPNSQCQCFATWQLERCGAGCGSRLASASWLVAQFRRRWCAAATANLHNALFCKVSASQSQAPFVAATASRPAGLQNRRYANLPPLERARQPPALPSRFASYVQAPVALVVCWHLGFSQLLRKSL
jgi:hypothetical protein